MAKKNIIVEVWVSDDRTMVAARVESGEYEYYINPKSLNLHGRSLTNSAVVKEMISEFRDDILDAREAELNAS